MKGTAYHEGLEVEVGDDTYYVDAEVTWEYHQATDSHDGSEEWDFKITSAFKYNPETGENEVFARDRWSEIEDDVHHVLYKMPWDRLTK